MRYTPPHPPGADYLVSLSYPGEQRKLVSSVADRLARELGRDRVFYDRFHEDSLPSIDLDVYLQDLYRYGSRLAVVFISEDYERKPWCGLEWRAIRDLIRSKERDRILLVRVDDAELPGIFGLDRYIDARVLKPEEVAERILGRLKWLEEDGRRRSETCSTRVARPGLVRDLLDYIFPRLHSFLTRLGTLSEPPEFAVLNEYLRSLKAHLENEIREKTYLPMRARPVPQGGAGHTGDPFVRPIHLVIRQILGRAEGGDSASAQIAAVNRQSRIVRDIVRALLRSPDPLVLLGDPGSGKTMTLQETALTLARSEIHRVFPMVTLYLRLGEFHVEGKPTERDVLTYVKSVTPESIRPYVEDLDRHGRLVVLFDGMDEMSRERYNEHTEALSLFAGSRQLGTSTLFSCRITDFSPAFLHRRLVLLPFDRTQIVAYLRRYLPAPSLEISGEIWSLPKLAREIAGGGLAVDATNPFVLWLLCLFVQERQVWPDSRVQLIEYFLEEAYGRKREETEDGEEVLPPLEEALKEWARIAFTITDRNRGSAIPVELLLEGADRERREQIRELILTGKTCGVLTESLQEEDHQIRFEHHRFQEYFTARWIRDSGQAIDWLDKLDAPRWQETMLNLVLMGTTEDAVLALAEAIETELPMEGGTDPEEEVEEVDLLYERETLLADRIELAARLIRGAPEAPIVGERLGPCVHERVQILIQAGRPITQVKMMRSCQNLPEINFMNLLEKPLRSPVQWVRDQAIILLGAAPTNRAAVEAAGLEAEMGVHFATNQFLSRWPAFFRATLKAGSRQKWLCLVLTTLFTLAELGLLIGASWAMFELMGLVARHSDEKDVMEAAHGIHEVHAGKLLVVGLGLSSLATLFALRRRLVDIWRWVLSSAPIGFGLAYSLLGLQLGYDKATAFIIFCLFGYYAWPFAAVGAVIHFGLLAIYCGLTRGFRSPYTMSTLAAIGWKEGEFAREIDLDDLAGAWRFIRSLRLRHIYGAIGRVRHLNWSVIAPPMVVGGILIGVSFLADLLLSLIEPWVTWLRNILGEVIAAIVAWLLLILLVLLIGALLFLLGRELIWLMRLLVVPRSPYPPVSWLPGEWKVTLQQAQPRQQRDLLRRTTHQTLGLRPNEFLHFLIEIEPLVREEPALSAYWEGRDQLEQALRQERQG